MKPKHPARPKSDASSAASPAIPESTGAGSLAANAIVPGAWLYIGKIGRPHGLNGAFYVADRDDAISGTYKVVIVGQAPETGRSLKVIGQRLIGDRTVLRLENHEDRTALTPLVGQQLWVARDSVTVDPVSEYLWADLEGSLVKDASDAEIGIVSSIANHGASDIIEIKRTDGRTASLPLVASYVDMEKLGHTEVVRLVVNADVLDDLWE